MLTRAQAQNVIYAYYAPILLAGSAKKVIPMQWDDPQGDSPVVFVQPEGTTFRNLNNTYFQLDYLIGMHVLVLDTREADDYVAQDADVTLNALNQEIVENFEPLLKNTNWQRIEWAAPSQVQEKVAFPGYVYRHELYVFKVMV